jgi:2,3-diaminopropionate biosynthesis protein SbnB
MLYLDTSDLHHMGVRWDDVAPAIEQAIRCMRGGDAAQPIKPYLRYRERTNRIIAMPAFCGGAVNMAGIKWIASFPGNLARGLPRAHSVVVLNESETGRPLAVIDGADLSAIRTAGVSAVMLRHFDRMRPFAEAQVGITGFGPIGQRHLSMISALLADRVAEIRIYDRKQTIDPAALPVSPRIRVVSDWRDAYDGADVFITCTVSTERYVDRPPKRNALLLNVSLRDFNPSIFPHVSQGLVVDEWAEVCREDTDIEVMHRMCGLEPKQTLSLAEVVLDGALRRVPDGAAVMFNPMGMAIFDIAVASHYYREALRKGVGVDLDRARASLSAQVKPTASLEMHRGNPC